MCFLVFELVHDPLVLMPLHPDNEAKKRSHQNITNKMFVSKIALTNFFLSEHHDEVNQFFLNEIIIPMLRHFLPAEKFASY